MANTQSQAEAIRDLLVERLELFDSSLDTSEGSALWTQVIAPVFAQMGTDPFDTDIRTFLKDRVTQSFPTVSAQEGDALADLLITPLEVLMEPLKREIQIVRTGQSARYPEQMRLEDARDLAANFFIEWNSGSRATGVVRIYFSAPTYLQILPTTEFSTASGLIFYPSSAQTVRPETMILFRSGTEYYVDVPLTSADTGSAYSVAKGSITSVKGITGYTRLANLTDFAGGADAETTTELLKRVRSSLTERTLNVRRGIVARIETDFAAVSDVEVVGYGDPEMQRDIVTGGGEGSVIASGVCIIVGQFVLMFSTFENRGNDGLTQISEGDEIELNFWSFLYSTETGAANEKFTIDTILFDSRNSITEMPSILLFRISNVPSVTAPVAGMLPGVLPGVFAVVRTTGKIEISDIPGGITNPNTVRGTIEINDNEIHIGGHYDVWLRTSNTTESSATMEDIRSESALVEGSDLVVAGESDHYRHIVHRKYTVSSTSSFRLDGALVCAVTGARATIARVSSASGTYTYELWESNGVLFAVSDSVTDGTTTGTLTAVAYSDWEDAGVERGMVLALPRGNEEGSYRILKVDGPFLYLDINLTTTDKAQLFRVLSEVSLDLFNTKSIIVPFGDADGRDLGTTIGSTTVRTGINLQDYGAVEGDTLEILSGDDQGAYTISEWSSFGGTGPVLSSVMSATNSNLEYRVYRATQPVERPLLRVLPDGVVLLDGAGQDSGYKIPNAVPVDARPVHAYSGAKALSQGLNGFVLMDPGSGWAPTEDYATDISGYDWASWTGGSFEDFYTGDELTFRRSYTDESLPSDGYIAVISVHGSNGQMYLDSNLPDNAKNFLSSMREWLLDIISTFGFGGDEEELVNAFSPIKFGPNEDTALPLILQFEIIIPYEVFDGCNNVFVALPEFDWENEFADADTFNEAIGRFNDGDMTGRDPALLKASRGDVLTVLSGLNTGSYVIERVEAYYLINGGAVVDGGGSINLDAAYKVGLVVIRDEFPVPALQGLPEFFKGGSVPWGLPAVTDLPFTVTDEDGNPVVGWDWVEQALTWFFRTLNRLGFDLPEDVSLDVPETLKAFWQMLFSSYAVGRPTAPQYLRLYFQEPTSCTVYAPTPCARYQWALPSLTTAEVEGTGITLPLPDLDGMTVSVEVERLSGSTTLSGTMMADFGTAATLEELAELLQTLLDPGEEYLLVSGPATPTGALTLTQVVGGVDEYVYVSAIDLTAGMRVLGFYGPAPAKFPELKTSTSCSIAYERITVGAGTALAFGLEIETDLTHLTPVAAFNGTFELGETVTSSGGATGVVWAIADDTTDAVLGHLWLVEVTGVFAAAETVTGDDSGATFVISVADETATIVDTNVTDGVDDITRTFEEVATMFQAEIIASVEFNVTAGAAADYDVIEISPTLAITVEFEDRSGTGAGPGRFVFSVEDTDHVDLVTGINIDSPMSGTLTDFAITYVNSTLPATTNSTTLNGMDYDPTVSLLEITVSDGTTPVVLAPSLTYWEALAFKIAVQDLIDAGDFEGAAQVLNADTDWCESSGTRYVLWVDGDTGLVARGIVGGTASSISLTNHTTFGFATASATGSSSVSWMVQGATEPGETQAAFQHPHAPTLFSTAVGAVELLFTPSDEATPYQVFPGQTSTGDTATVDLPRDLVVGSPYEGQLSVEVRFTDADYASPIELDIREESDWLYVYEQRRLLEHTSYEASDTDVSSDRVSAVVTSFGSNKVQLLNMSSIGLSDEFTFLAPNTGLDGDQVQVGDVLFIEEGDDLGGYTVTERSAYELVLDKNLTVSSGRIYRYGNDGILVLGGTPKVTSPTAAFTNDDIGRYLTIWLSNRENVDGSYKITAVETDGSGCTLEGDPFTLEEADLHWAVVKAPTETVGASETGGRSALVGLRPVRIYSGEPTKLQIVKVSPTLDRAEAAVYTTVDEDLSPPRSGVRQPYKVVRPGTQHISATAMNEQRSRGLYYFDVLTTSLGGDDVYNLPRDVKMEPVFGTYDSYGYRIDVTDSRFSFSTREEASLVLSSVFLPNGLDDQLSNFIALNGRSIRLDYEYAPTVAEVQSLLLSDDNRVLCADPLARHFLPAYVSLDITYVGGNKTSTVAGALSDYVNGLSAVDELDLAELERILHNNGVAKYDHPIRLITLTHDLDRRIVGTQAEDRINDDNIAYNGTNRTTFFIAGTDASTFSAEEDVPPGARIWLVRESSRSTFR